MQELHISVRNLVEFILRSGDIDHRSGRMMTDAMLEGGKIHRKIQRSMGEDYQAEVPLALTIDAKNYRLVVEGRADGIAYGRFPNEKVEAKQANALISETTVGDAQGTARSNDKSDTRLCKENIFGQLIIEDFASSELVASDKNNDTQCDNDQDKHCIEQENMVYIDEIKGMYRNVQTMVEPVSVHLAQAKCYAYIYALQKNLDQIGVQMTYCNLDTEERKYFQEVFAWDDLAEWFGNLIAEYRKWADWQIMWHEKRQESIQNLEFPYPYREGQRKLVGDVYRTIKRGKNLFIQAPTGVGKTISTIFPAVKAVGEELADRIFYLTAKTITATVAKDTFGLLREQGYQAKVIQLTAKEKLCLCGRSAPDYDNFEEISVADVDDLYPDFPQVKLECNPQNCPYAQGHFDRVNDAVFELLQESDQFTRDEILAQAEKYRVCPFELSLDVATWCDDILCDYNYVFDPNVYLKRFFQDNPKEKFLFLVDEAHNLVDRSREMYSAALYKEDVLAVRKIMKVQNRAIARSLDKCNQAMLDMKRECETYEVCESVGVLTFHLMRLLSQMEEFFEKPREFPDRKTVLDFYFALRNFLNIYDLVDENYVIYDELQEDGRFMIKLFCVDPSKNLQKCIDKSVSTIFFSATLLPINYYKRLLSTKEDNYAIYAQSTFDEKQRLLLFGRDVSTKYTRRGPEEYAKIAAYIRTVIRGKQGNYMVFFPSYKMMQDVCEVFVQAEQGSDAWDSVAKQDKQRNSADELIRDQKNCADDSGDQKNEQNQCEDDCLELQSEQETRKISNGLTIIMQRSNMNEAEREEFLQAFEESRNGTLVAFCVMGGIFGEGIDLKRDRLIGAIIVGTGLPQISNEREILKQYYDKQGLSGFDYAFRYPGINKVLQAAGRVIRTQEDRGIIALLDERFLQSDYDALYPREWSRRVVGDVNLLNREIQAFWGKTNLILSIRQQF